MSSSLRFCVLSVILFATFGAVGLVHGLWTGRWPAIGEMETLAELERLPLVIGAWDGKTLEMSEREKQFYGEGTILTRRYVNREDGEIVMVALSRGRPGPMVIKHLPTECYISNGYELEASPQRVLVDRSDVASSANDPSDEFRVAVFKKMQEAAAQRVRVYWSWSGNGQWQTPDRPRFAFARYPLLYKLYVCMNVPGNEQPSSGASVRDFMQDLTQAMRVTMFRSAAR